MRFLYIDKIQEAKKYGLKHSEAKLDTSTFIQAAP